MGPWTTFDWSMAIFAALLVGFVIGFKTGLTLGGHP